MEPAGRSARLRAHQAGCGSRRRIARPFVRNEDAATRPDRYGRAAAARRHADSGRRRDDDYPGAHNHVQHHSRRPAAAVYRRGEHSQRQDQRAKNAAPAKAATAFQRTDLNGAANAPAAPAEPAPEVTNELSSRAADGLLVNGSAQNGASSPFAQNPAFGNNRRGGPRLYNYGLVLNESNSALNASQFSLSGAHTPKPPANQFTGSFNFGGPIKIPHLDLAAR